MSWLLDISVGALFVAVAFLWWAIEALMDEFKNHLQEHIDAERARYARLMKERRA